MRSMRRAGYCQTLRWGTVSRVISLMHLCQTTTLDRLPSLYYYHHHSPLILIHAGYIKPSKSPPTTPSLLLWSPRLISNEIMIQPSWFWRRRCAAALRGQTQHKKDSNQSFCGCIQSTCYLFSTSHTDQTQQAVQNKHPSILWDSQPFWVTAQMKTTLTLSGSAEANSQLELYKGWKDLMKPS